MAWCGSTDVDKCIQSLFSSDGLGFGPNKVYTTELHGGAANSAMNPLMNPSLFPPL